MPNIEFKDVTAYYENTKNKTVALVLEHFSFEFKKDIITSIVGQSGCGKTTLLKCITDTVKYDGDIYFDEKNTDDTLIKERKIAYVSQLLDLWPKKTVFDNIAFPLQVLKVKPLAVREKVYQYAEEFNIAFALARKVRELSVGQQKIVSFIKAIIKEPSVILLDELTSGVDPDNKKYILKTLKEYLKKHKCTCIMVTHDINDAMLISNQIVIMDDGKIIEVGNPKKIFASKNKITRNLFHAEEVDKA